MGADSGSEDEEEAEAEGASSAQSNGKATTMTVVLDCSVGGAVGPVGAEGGR